MYQRNQLNVRLTVELLNKLKFQDLSANKRSSQCMSVVYPVSGPAGLQARKIKFSDAHAYMNRTYVQLYTHKTPRYVFLLLSSIAYAKFLLVGNPTAIPKLDVSKINVLKILAINHRRRKLFTFSCYSIWTHRSVQNICNMKNPTPNVRTVQSQIATK